MFKRGDHVRFIPRSDWARNHHGMSGKTAVAAGASYGYYPDITRYTPLKWDVFHTGYPNGVYYTEDFELVALSSFERSVSDYIRRELNV